MRLIDADRLKRTLKYWIRPDPDLDNVMDLIDGEPTAEIEPRHGKWIDADMGFCGSLRYKLARCSNCKMGYGKAMALADFRYCPNCGAKMDGEQT